MESKELVFEGDKKVKEANSKSGCEALRANAEAIVNYKEAMTANNISELTSKVKQCWQNILKQFEELKKNYNKKNDFYALANIADAYRVLLKFNNVELVSNLKVTTKDESLENLIKNTARHYFSKASNFVKKQNLLGATYCHMKAYKLGMNVRTELLIYGQRVIDKLVEKNDYIKLGILYNDIEKMKFDLENHFVEQIVKNCYDKVTKLIESNKLDTARKIYRQLTFFPDYLLDDMSEDIGNAYLHKGYDYATKIANEPSYEKRIDIARVAIKECNKGLQIMGLDDQAEETLKYSKGVIAECQHWISKGIKNDYEKNQVLNRNKYSYGSSDYSSNADDDDKYEEGRDAFYRGVDLLNEGNYSDAKREFRNAYDNGSLYDYEYRDLINECDDLDEQRKTAESEAFQEEERRKWQEHEDYLEEERRKYYEQFENN